MKGMKEKVRSLKDYMVHETKNLKDLASLENKLQRCVLDKDWTELEGLLRRLQTKASEVLEIENSRNLLYGELRRGLNLKDSEGFYDFLSKIEIDERVELAGLYRELRLSVSEVQSVTGGIDTYITATVSTMGRVLEELFPSRKMRMYTKTGASHAAAQPMVFSHCL